MQAKIVGLAAVVASTLLSMTVLSQPSSAIVGGEYDGNQHPNVGIVVALDENGQGLGGWCFSRGGDPLALWFSK
jgi:hypothetical protein